MSVREPGVHVEFVMHPVVHGLKSQQEGREVCVDKPHVNIRVAGNDKETYFGPATVEMQARFPEEWAAFQRGSEVARVGTPIEHWPRLTSQPSMVRMLKNLAIYTVEDMASCTDAALQKVGMGGHKMREDAKKFLEIAAKTADSSKMDELKAQNAALLERLEALEKASAEPAPAKRGPKPKVQAQA